MPWRSSKKCTKALLRLHAAHRHWTMQRTWSRTCYFHIQSIRIISMHIHAYDVARYGKVSHGMTTFIRVVHNLSNLCSYILGCCTPGGRGDRPWFLRTAMCQVLCETARTIHLAAQRTQRHQRSYRNLVRCRWIHFLYYTHSLMHPFIHSYVHQFSLIWSVGFVHG